MSNFIKTATTEELHLIMDGLLETKETTPEQADMLYAIVDELRERGVAEVFSEEENEAFAQKMLEKALSAQKSPKRDGSFVERILREAEIQRRISSQKRKRRLTAVAITAMVILLINTITVSASGVNFLGDFLGWTGQAIYSLFGGKPVEEVKPIHEEMQPLQVKLDELGVSVRLPSFLSDGLRFKSLEVVVGEEPYILFSWFENRASGKELLLKIDGSIGDGVATKSETNSNIAQETILVNGTEYSFYENHDRLKVVWNDGIYELTLQGDLTYKEAKTVIESIQR